MEKIKFSNKVQKALDQNLPIVALESAVITHGLPRPTNFTTASAMEDAISNQNGTPATICLIKGSICIGIDTKQLDFLSNAMDAIKVSKKDIAYAIAYELDGGTTVSGTMTIAHAAGLKVFATGGIGGIHRGNPFDISADLPTLAQTPMIVVCSGAKAILDLKATRENLETSGVPVLGYQTNELPAFYSVNSGIKVDLKVNSAEEICAIAQNHWSMGLSSAILVVVPPPADSEIPSTELSKEIEEALEEAKKNKIMGAAITPFLLQKVNEKTKGKSMEANIALLKNNASVAAKISRALYSTKNS